MRVILRTMAEFVGLGVLALILAFAVNAVRGKSIDVTRPYFNKGPASPPPRSEVDRDAGRGTDDPPVAKETSSTPAVSASSAPLTPPAEAAAMVEDPPLNHGFQEVSLEQVTELFNHELAQIHVYLFVDARNDTHYEEGHIPRAIQADHYHLERYIDNLLSYAEAAEKIIVYCNGGDCEDSIFMCNDLLDAGVPYDNIYLFAGGWKAWKAANMPIETGRSNE